MGSKLSLWRLGKIKQRRLLLSGRFGQKIHQYTNSEGIKRFILKVSPELLSAITRRSISC